jgi:hypothetical protein
VTRLPHSCPGHLRNRASLTFRTPAFGRLIRRDELRRWVGSVHRAAQEKLAQTLTPLVCSTRKPAHAKARNGVAWQLLALGFAQTLAVDLGRAEGVVAQDAFGLRRIGEHVDRTDAAPAVLLGKAMQILIECR